MRWAMVSRVDELVPGEHAKGAMVWDPALPLFEDHFPHFAVVPGVLQLEALAQLSGFLIGFTVRNQRGDWPFPILSMMDKVKFRKFVRPGQEEVLETKLLTLRDEMAAVQVRGRLDGKVVSQAEQIFVFNAVPIEDPADRQRIEAIERTQLRSLWAGYPGDPK